VEHTNNIMEIDTFIEKQTTSLQQPQATIPVVALSDDGDKDKKELRKKLKKHRKYLSEKSDEYYDKGEKELSKKYREMANKLSDDMNDESSEMSLSNYQVEESSLKNPELSSLMEVKTELEAQLSALQTEVASLRNAQLSQNTAMAKTISLSNEEKVTKLGELLNQAKQLLEGDK